MYWEFWINRCKLPYIEWINKVLLYRTFLVPRLVKNLPAMWEAWVRTLSWEDSLGIYIYLSVCTHTHTHTYIYIFFFFGHTPCLQNLSFPTRD